MPIYVYLSGETHTSWRNKIQRGAEVRGWMRSSPAVTDRDASDAAVDYLGAATTTEQMADILAYGPQSGALSMRYDSGRTRERGEGRATATRDEMQ